MLIPCYNEEVSIGKVVKEFRDALPSATVFVYDNNSTDRSAEIAREAGAIVCRERLQGKGHVVRRMFADIEAEIYVLVDGDDTYEPGSAPEMLALLLNERLDMVTATRVPQSSSAYRPGHQFGNRLLTGLVTRVFGRQLSDMLSGYRVFSRRFVKSFPALSSGFEIETEFTVHALELRMPTAETTSAYRTRQLGSESKLSTYYDGLRILRAIIVLIKDERPLPFFFLIATMLFGAAFGLGLPVVMEFARTGLVPRLPTAVLATGFMLSALLSITCGLILDSVMRGRKEAKRLAYLAIPSVASMPSMHCPI